MKNFLYAHGGSANHGCEAILRSTAKLFSNSDIWLYSYQLPEEQYYGTDQLCRIIDPATAHLNRRSLRFLAAYAALKLHRDEKPLLQCQDLSMMELAPKDAIAFSIGGDNYCYAGAEKYMCDRAFLAKRGQKTVLWGCSVEPDMIDKKMRKDLSRYDLIVARESITYDALKDINPNTVLAPDPAFTLERQPGLRPDGLGEKPYIGINVSPLICALEQDGGITLDNYRALISHILTTTDRDIALIPHVVWQSNDDRKPLGKLYDEFKSTSRVFMVEDQNCMQLKDIIAGCEFFIGARTHATIAAYSTCVPTLVVGYSVKARGIAKDLFGTDEGYVLPVQVLRKKDDLINAFSALYLKRADIQQHLTEMMPDHIGGIKAAVEAVEKL